MKKELNEELESESFQKIKYSHQIRNKNLKGIDPKLKWKKCMSFFQQSKVSKFIFSSPFEHKQCTRIFEEH